MTEAQNLQTQSPWNPVRLRLKLGWFRSDVKPRFVMDDSDWRLQWRGPSVGSIRTDECAGTATTASTESGACTTASCSSRDGTAQTDFLLPAAFVGHLGTVRLEPEPRIELARLAIAGQHPQRHPTPTIRAKVRKRGIH